MQTDHKCAAAAAAQIYLYSGTQTYIAGWGRSQSMQNSSWSHVCASCGTSAILLATMGYCT